MANGEIDRLAQEVSNETQQDQQGTSSIARASADLERELLHEKEARREERFIYLAAIVVWADAFIFKSMEAWTGPIVIGVIELVAFTVYARRCGIDEVIQLLDRLGTVLKRDKSRSSQEVS